MPRPMGSIHFLGMASMPWRMPKIEPAVAAVQSVSSPQLTVMHIVFSKSPSP